MCYLCHSVLNRGWIDEWGEEVEGRTGCCWPRISKLCQNYLEDYLWKCEICGQQADTLLWLSYLQCWQILLYAESMCSCLRTWFEQIYFIEFKFIRCFLLSHLSQKEYFTSTHQSTGLEPRSMYSFSIVYIFLALNFNLFSSFCCPQLFF